MATLGTDESDSCREMRSFLIWAPIVLVDTISRYSVDISVKIYQSTCQPSIS